MIALYNDIDPFAAQWMRALIDEGHIAPGSVNEQSIEDIEPAAVAGPGQRHFFAGIGGWSYALRLAGIPDDATIWTGSCPCQPFSSAGKRSGFRDSRHLWPAWFALIRECRPPIIFGEQVASSDGLAWLDVVFADLERCGYAVGAADLCAAGIGAPHIRQRLFFVAHAGQNLRGPTRKQEPANEKETERSKAAVYVEQRSGAVLLGNADRERDENNRSGTITCETSGLRREAREQRIWSDAWQPSDAVYCLDGKRRPIEPGTFPLAHGVPARVGRLRGYGNAIVPQVAATFIRASLQAMTNPLNEEMGDETNH